MVLILVIMETLSLAGWTLFRYVPPNWRLFTDLDAYVFRIVLPLSPMLLLLTLYTWVFEGARLTSRYSRRFERGFGVIVQARDRLLRWILGSQPSISGEVGIFRHSRIWL